MKLRSDSKLASELSTTERGRNAEKIARRRLRQLGYQVLEANHRNQAGEIDLIARDGDTLCFVEVKARTTTEFGSAADAVDWRKQKRLRRAASLYLTLDGWEGPCRFDVVALDRQTSPAARPSWKVTIYENAF